ncbi:hypothetical protein G5I_12549 [Acromyrmex echinatior]|uniref:Uncharacterized protein n=1 Tax=Acromyrmex echinatior TaxID=103372 RepID=F4X2L9_ACREC|nr:hypothetical protein G5I_12549 [Acromyrmex echinatior]
MLYNLGPLVNPPSPEGDQIPTCPTLLRYGGQCTDVVEACRSVVEESSETMRCNRVRIAYATGWAEAVNGRVMYHAARLSRDLRRASQCTSAEDGDINPLGFNVRFLQELSDVRRLRYSEEDQILTLSEIGGLQRAAGRFEYLFCERTDLISVETRVVMPNREGHLTPN